MPMPMPVPMPMSMPMSMSRRSQITPPRLLVLVCLLALAVLAPACAEDPAGGGAGDEGTAIGDDPTTGTGEATDATSDETTDEQGTGSTPGTGTDQATDLDREPAGGPDAMSQFVGELGGSDIEGGCVWLDADDGTRYELVTGTTSDVRIDPANQLLVSADGEVIAEAGDRVVVEGQVDEGLMTFCQVGVNLVVQDARMA